MSHFLEVGLDFSPAAQLPESNPFAHTPPESNPFALTPPESHPFAHSSSTSSTRSSKEQETPERSRAGAISWAREVVAQRIRGCWRWVTSVRVRNIFDLKQHGKTVRYATDVEAQIA